MIVRSYDEIAPVEWGNGTSHRLLTESDGLGFTVCETLVRQGTTSALQYRRHLEACYCIGGSGEVVTADGERHKIVEGTLYALDKHDAHYLVASDDEDQCLEDARYLFSFLPQNNVDPPPYAEPRDHHHGPLLAAVRRGPGLADRQDHREEGQAGGPDDRPGPRGSGVCRPGARRARQRPVATSSRSAYPPRR